MKIRSALAVLLLASSNVAFAHDAPPTPEPMSLDELSGAFGWSFDTEITTESVTDDLHVLFGVGGNIVVSVGDDGVLIVDDQFPQMMRKITSAIRNLVERRSTWPLRPTGTSITPRGI